MSLAGRKRRRQTEIVQRMKRRAKVAKLKARIADAKTEGDKVILLRKLRRVAPGSVSK
ncbi:MAG TPA: hypothetical protein PK997_06925 [Candidatus Omnitrophota bacterium]|jgi:hypothetical protein|nr:MAG: hypothetical protein BWY49_00892 [Candidatus Omnitrophica bacterium ADurb.Bin314]HOE68540.1 hypothetical protein [Candidatus Omnitrophota bacterium]HQB94923.1 hypothetical protein [Candidatus Omnitrophota bacterium]